MAYSRPLFWTEPGLITHIPTCARFSFYKNSEFRDVHINYGKAGDVMANGDDYSQQEVKHVAETIFNRIREKR